MLHFFDDFDMTFATFVNVDSKISTTASAEPWVTLSQFAVTDEQLEDWVQDVKRWSQGMAYT